ncbi:fimbria/pilus chaperone family protein [Enterobacter roggenkampii]
MLPCSSVLKNKWSASLFVIMFAFKASLAMATGMVPETSLLLVNEQDKGANMKVTNTDDHPSLLYTNIVDLPDDKGVHVIVTQPVTRVNAGQTQQLRFILDSETPMKVEHFKRLTLEGIPPKTEGKNQLTINIRQDLPVLIHPAGLPVVQDAWKLLKWNVSGNTLHIQNDSPYVVRVSDQLELLPSKTDLKIGKTYILPGQNIDVKSKSSIDGARQVKIFPVSRYGVPVEPYLANIE